MSLIFSLIPNQVNTQVFLSIPLVFNTWWAKRRELKKKKKWVLQITATQWLKITDYLSYSSILTGPPILTNEMSEKVLTDSLLWVLASAFLDETSPFRCYFPWRFQRQTTASQHLFSPLSLCHFFGRHLRKKKQSKLVHVDTLFCKSIQKARWQVSLASMLEYGFVWIVWSSSTVTTGSQQTNK